MKLNKKKMEIVCNGVAMSRPRRGLMIDAEQLLEQEVTKYKYLVIQFR